MQTLQGDKKMTRDDIKLIYDLFGMTPERFNEYRDDVIKGFCQFGTDFLQHLASALNCCETRDEIKIMHTWRKECVEHEMLWKIYQAKQKATSA